MTDTTTRQEQDTKPTPGAVAAAALGVPEKGLGAISQTLPHQEFRAVSHAVAQAVGDAGQRALAAAGGDGVPTWSITDGAIGELLHYTSAIVLTPAGLIGPDEVVVRLFRGSSGQWIEATAPLDRCAALPSQLSAFITRVTTTGSPFRLGRFHARYAPGGPLLSRWEPHATTREDLLLPDEVWAAVDRHAHGPLTLAGELAALGLAASSGLLCVGPPGTGKSQLARIVAHELAGRATVLLPDVSTARHSLKRLMAVAAQLAPTLVIIDDLDLVVGSRHGDGETLHEFLSTMDANAEVAAGVIVMASTNDPRSIDPAAIRASRFDAVIEMAPPSLEGRTRILGRFLSGFPDVDLHRLAAATPGATGADLKDLARRAFLASAGAVTTDGVLGAIEDGRWQEKLTTGAYL